MLFNKNKKFKGFSRIFIRFFVVWFSLVSLVAPLKSVAYTFDQATLKYTLSANETVVNGYIYENGQPKSNVFPGSTIINSTGQTTNIPFSNAGNNAFNTDTNVGGTSAFQYTDANGLNANPFGLEALPTGPGNPSAAAANPDAYASGGSPIGVGDLAQQTLASVGTCSIGAILGRLISSLIGSLIALLKSFIQTVIVKTVGSVIDCASKFWRVCTTDPDAQNGLASLNAKSTGAPNFSITGLFGTLIPAPSMDSIMFCIVNEILTYITQATINWINSGFNGNPVFVQNPGALLQTVADQEANNFIMNLTGGGVQSGGLGIPGQSGGMHIFDDPLLQRQLALNVLNSYNYNSLNNPMAGVSSPTISSYAINAQAQGQYLGYDAGARQYDPRNNLYGQTLALNNARYQREAAAKENQRMRMMYGNGYISPSTCANGYIDPITKVCKNYGIMDTHSAHAIGTTLQNRDMMTYMRVALAKDFDSIITALVNQLIKIAVTEISKKTGISPTTIYSTGLNALQNSGTSATGQAFDASGNPIPKATPVNGSASFGNTIPQAIPVP